MCPTLLMARERKGRGARLWRREDGPRGFGGPFERHTASARSTVPRSNYVVRSLIQVRGRLEWLVDVNARVLRPAIGEAVEKQSRPRRQADGACHKRDVVEGRCVLCACRGHTVLGMASAHQRSHAVGLVQVPTSGTVAWSINAVKGSADGVHRPCDVLWAVLCQRPVCGQCARSTQTHLHALLSYGTHGHRHRQGSSVSRVIVIDILVVGQVVEQLADVPDHFGRP